jgi:hypothetical protein
MPKIKFTEAELEQLYQQFLEHPSGSVKNKLHVIYLKSIGLPHYEITRIARIGILRTYCPVSALSRSNQGAFSKTPS